MKTPWFRLHSWPLSGRLHGGSAGQTVPTQPRSTAGRFRSSGQHHAVTVYWNCTQPEPGASTWKGRPEHGERSDPVRGS